MNLKDKVKEKLIGISPELLSHGVVKIGIFGSVLRGDYNNKSDIDFLVDFDPKFLNFDNFLFVSELIENTMDRKVEVVTKGGLSKYIGPHILKEVEYFDLGN